MMPCLKNLQAPGELAGLWKSRRRRPPPFPLPFADYRFTELGDDVCSYILSDETIVPLKAEPTSSGFKLLEPTEPFGILTLPPGGSFGSPKFDNFEWIFVS